MGALYLEVVRCLRQIMKLSYRRVVLWVIKIKDEIILREN
ncbi:hypothetical protein LX92_03487 [Maribacter polysiphoniae]|uniref:Uncharacterized protein n=1 Tax=Maribacter polysiphoniae TaxID=429344 RepID=A0A316DW76_9FLAO|nr:hypothetical protein LX92_03487 [Maribacter polysiphoniae]